MSAKIKILERKGSSLYERLYLFEVFKGMAVTFRHFITNFIDNSKLLCSPLP
jgi:NADH-quinone oxidoreductase subunit I